MYILLLLTILLSAVSVGSACTDMATAALLNELHTFMYKMGERYVPMGMQLEITVADIDLAGDFEPWRGLQFGHVRLTRDIYRPHVSLEFRLTDSRGSVVSAGQRAISASDYQERFVRLPDDYLRYEKALLHDWFRNEFGAIKPSLTPVRSGGLQ